MGVLEGVGGKSGFCPACRRGFPAFGGVIHPNRDILHPIAMLDDVRIDRAIRCQRGGEDQNNLVLLQDIGRAVFRARFQSRIGVILETKCRLEKVGRLFGVADIEFDMVCTVKGDEVLGFRVFNRKFERGRVRLHG